MTAYEESQRLHFKEQAYQWLAEHGWKPGELQSLWRGPGCFERKYDTTEVGYAIIEGLVQEGMTAWWGDGTSIVEQMVRLQFERASRAEARVGRLQDVIESLERELDNCRKLLARRA